MNRVFDERGFDQWGIHYSIPDEEHAIAYEFYKDTETQNKLSKSGITDIDSQYELYKRHHKPVRTYETILSEEDVQRFKDDFRRTFKKELTDEQALERIKKFHKSNVETGE